MRSTTSNEGIQRVITGNRCEEERCYELALWLVNFNGETSHWCAKHTRSFMRDNKLWGEKRAPDIER